MELVPTSWSSRLSDLGVDHKKTSTNIVLELILIFTGGLVAIQENKWPHHRHTVGG